MKDADIYPSSQAGSPSEDQLDEMACAALKQAIALYERSEARIRAPGSAARRNAMFWNILLVTKANEEYRHLLFFRTLGLFTAAEARAKAERACEAERIFFAEMPPEQISWGGQQTGGTQASHQQRSWRKVTPGEAAANIARLLGENNDT